MIWKSLFHKASLIAHGITGFPVNPFMARLFLMALHQDDTSISDIQSASAVRFFQALAAPLLHTQSSNSRRALYSPQATSPAPTVVK
jgi:hypothetical protein